MSTYNMQNLRYKEEDELFHIGFYDTLAISDMEMIFC